jgi:hypothetical protein
VRSRAMPVSKEIRVEVPEGQPPAVRSNSCCAEIWFRLCLLFNSLFLLSSHFLAQPQDTLLPPHVIGNVEQAFLDNMHIVFVFKTEQNAAEVRLCLCALSGPPVY